jgi:hypothetical protein
MGQTGKSRDSIQMGISIGISVVVDLALSSSPGFAILELGGLIVDIIDPNQYSLTLNRASVDQYSSLAYSSTKDVFQSDEVIQLTTEYVNEEGQSLSIDERRNIIAKAISYWKIFTLEPDNFDLCFQDLVFPTDDISASGPPIQGCDFDYALKYNEYVNDNKQSYIDNQIETGQNFVETLNALLLGLLQLQVTEERENYLNYIYLFIGIIVVSITAIITWFLINKYTSK